MSGAAPGILNRAVPVILAAICSSCGRENASSLPPDERGIADTAAMMVISTFTPDSLGFGRIASLGVSETGEVLVADATDSHIYRFAPAGELRQQIGRPGSGPGEFRLVSAIVFQASDRIVLRDIALSRLVVMSSSGVAHAYLTIPSAELSGQEALRVLRGGRLLVGVARTARGSFERRSLQYLMLDSMGGAVGSPFELPERYAVACPIVRLVSPGAPVLGQAPSPVWTVSAGGDVVAGCAKSYSLDVVADGRISRTIRKEVPAVRRSEEERSELVTRFETQMRREMFSWKWAGPDIPITHGAFSKILIAEDGRWWVRTPRTSTRCLPDESCAWRERHGYDVFDETGRFLFSVNVSGAFRHSVDPVIRGDTVWAMTGDPEGRISVTRFQLSRAPSSSSSKPR